MKNEEIIWEAIIDDELVSLYDKAMASYFGSLADAEADAMYESYILDHEYYEGYWDYENEPNAWMFR